MKRWDVLEIVAVIVMASVFVVAAGMVLYETYPRTRTYMEVYDASGKPAGWLEVQK